MAGGVPTDGDGSQAPPSPERSAFDYYLGPHLSQGLRGTGNALAWALQNIIPGTSDAESLNQAVAASRRIGPEVMRGNFGQAGLQTGEMLANMLSTLPAVPALGGIIVGRKALQGGQNLNDLLRAEEILAKEMPGKAQHEIVPDELKGRIFDEAGGWYRGVDGRWRREIPDTRENFRWKMDPKDLPETKGVRLSEALDAPHLFESYPGMRTLPLSKRPGMGAEHYPATAFEDARIRLGIDSGSPERLLSILAHEVQHGVQDLEGFARGGSPANMQFFPGAFEDIVPKTAPTGELPSLEQFKGILERTFKHSFRGMPEDEIQRRYQALVADYTKMGMGGGGVPTFSRQINDSDAMEAYKRLLGEVEARSVQNRLSKALNDMQSNPRPWVHQDVPEAQQLTYKGAGRPTAIGQTRARNDAIEQLQGGLTRFKETQDASRRPGSLSSASTKTPPRPNKPPMRDSERVLLDRLLRDIQDAKIPPIPWVDY